jgi:hypothetical protein
MSSCRGTHLPAADGRETRNLLAGCCPIGCPEAPPGGPDETRYRIVCRAFLGGPGRIRTSDRRIMSPLL